MAPFDVPPRKCSLKSLVDSTLVPLLLKSIRARADRKHRERQRELLCSNIKYQVRSAEVVGDAVRSGTFSDRCHLAPYASARSAIHKNTIKNIHKLLLVGMEMQWSACRYLSIKAIKLANETQMRH